MYAFRCEYCGKLYNAEKGLSCPHCGAEMSDASIRTMRKEMAEKERQDFERQKERLRAAAKPSRRSRRRFIIRNPLRVSILFIVATIFLVLFAANAISPLPVPQFIRTIGRMIMNR